MPPIGQSQISKHNHVSYSVKCGYWFGPTARAIEAFRNTQPQSRLSEIEYLAYLEKNHADIYASIEWVTFQPFSPNRHPRGKQAQESNKQDLWLALTYTKPNPKHRDELFNVREQITANTGWYPLVLGSRAALSSPEYVKALRQISVSRRALNYGFLVGDILSVQNVSKNVERDGSAFPLVGNAILLEGSRGNILLDTGFDIEITSLSKLRAVFLSHLHGDHIGGFVNVLEKSNPFTLLSDATLAYLCETALAQHPLRQKLLQKAYVLDAPTYVLHTDGVLDTFRVFHAPGAYGLSYRDPSGNALFYFGDLCVKNGFLDFSKELFQRLDSLDAKKKTVLLDSAMVRRKDFSFEVEDTPKEIIKELHEGVRRRDILFITASIEAAIYSYILAFHYTSEHDKSVKMVINDQLFNLTRRLIQPVLRRQQYRIDPYIQKLLGKSISNFIESQRVYPLSALEQFDSSSHLVIFASKSDLSIPALQKRLRKSDAVIAGTQAWVDDADLQSALKYCRVVHRVDSPDWSFHTSDLDLAELISKLSQMSIQSILFHNGSDTLKKWIKDNKFDPTLVMPLRHSPVPLC